MYVRVFPQKYSLSGPGCCMWTRLLESLLNPRIFFLWAFGLTILFQPVKTGFEKGHHGWVSSHTLAIITRAGPENLFLGYTRDEMKNGKVDQDYFDRYPFIFSGSFNLLLKPFWDNLSSYVYFARQLMNLIYLLSGFLIYRLLSRLADSRKAVAATALVMSSAFFVRYKDMVHFDQPAILGCLLAFNGIVDYEKTNNKKFLILGVFLGPVLGRGYAVIVFLFSWYLVSTIRGFKVAGAIKSVFNKSLLFLVLSVPFPAIMLGWNIYSESRIRNVEIAETSIVKSAKHRIGLQKYKVREGGEKEFKWASFLNNQVQRALDLTTPYFVYGIHVKNFKEKFLHYSTLLPKLIFQLGLVAFLILQRKRIKALVTHDMRRMIPIFCLSGIIWILLMRHLANYHEYVSLYLFGLLLTLSLIVIKVLEEKKSVLLRFVPLVLFFSLGMNFLKETVVSRNVNWQSEKFMEIRSVMKEKGLKSAYVGENFYDFMEGVPHAPDFYLKGFAVTTDKSQAEIFLKANSGEIDYFFR